MNIRRIKTKLSDLRPNYFNSIDRFELNIEGLDVEFPFDNPEVKDCEELLNSLLIFYKKLKENGALPKCEKTGESILFDKGSILDKIFEKSFSDTRMNQTASSFYYDFFTKLPAFANELTKITFGNDIDDNSHYLGYLASRIFKNLENGSMYWSYTGNGPHTKTCRCNCCYTSSSDDEYDGYLSTSDWLCKIENISL